MFWPRITSAPVSGEPVSAGQRRGGELLCLAEEPDVLARQVLHPDPRTLRRGRLHEVFNNRRRLHPTLGYRTPFAALAEFQTAAIRA